MPRRARACGASRLDLRAVETDHALGRRQKPDQRLHQRRFANAVAADDGNDLAIAHVEVDALQDRLAAIAAAQALEREKSPCVRHGGRSMALPEIDLRDALVGDDLVDRALRENPAEVQHGDARGDLPHEGHIVLDGEHRHAFGLQRPHHFARRARLLRRHAGGRLVEKQQLGFQADRHADFQPLLLPVAEIAGRLRGVGPQIEKIELPLDLAAQAVALEMVLQRDLEVLRDAQRLEDSRHLELDADAAPDSRAAQAA